LIGRQAAQVFFDTVECLDLSQAFLRDWSSARLGDVMQFSPRVCPAIGQHHILCELCGILGDAA